MDLEYVVMVTSRVMGYLVMYLHWAKHVEADTSWS